MRTPLSATSRWEVEVAEKRLQKLFLQAQRDQACLSMSVINMGEVLYILIKNLGEQRALHYIQVLQHGVTTVEADLNQTIQAAT
jgi:hypothetical protein